MDKIVSANIVLEIGKRLGNLVILDITTSSNHGSACKCECDCGSIVLIQSAKLRWGRTTSCGRNCSKYHGEEGTRLYTIWCNIKARCKNPKEVSYKYYGARGISYSPEWEKYIPFRDWARKTGYQEHLTIDRVDNDGNYEPSNCRWATQSEQNSNKRPYTCKNARPCNCNQIPHKWSCPIHRQVQSRQQRLNKKLLRKEQA